MIDPFQIVINVYLVLITGVFLGVFCFAVASYLEVKVIPKVKKIFNYLQQKREEKRCN